MEKLKGTKSWRLESQYIDIQISSIARKRHIHHNAARSHAPISSSLRCRSRNPLWKIRYKSWDQWNSVSTDDHTKPYNALRNTACGRGSLTSLKGEDLTRGERVAPGFTKVRNKSSTPRLLKKTVRTYVSFSFNVVTTLIRFDHGARSESSAWRQGDHVGSGQRDDRGRVAKSASSGIRSRRLRGGWVPRWRKYMSDDAVNDGI